MARASASTPQWRILALLVACSFLCLVERTNLSIGATDIQRDLHLIDARLARLDVSGVSRAKCEQE